MGQEEMKRTFSLTYIWIELYTIIKVSTIRQILDPSTLTQLAPLLKKSCYVFPHAQVRIYLSLSTKRIHPFHSHPPTKNRAPTNFSVNTSNFDASKPQTLGFSFRSPISFLNKKIPSVRNSRSKKKKNQQKRTRCLVIQSIKKAIRVELENSSERKYVRIR